MKSLIFASKAHAGQVRKYTGEPYISHPIAVGLLVADAMRGDEWTKKERDIAIDCAVLHDVVEDTYVTIEDIQREFGDAIAKGVWFLSDPPNFVGNRKLRKKMTRERLKNAPDYIKLVKACDIKHNSISIEEHDPDFFVLFEKETMKLLEYIA